MPSIEALPEEVLNECLSEFLSFSEFRALRQTCKGLSKVAPPPRVREFKTTLVDGESSVADLCSAGLDWCRWALFLNWDAEFDFLSPAPLVLDVYEESDDSSDERESTRAQRYSEFLEETLKKHGPKVWDVEQQRHVDAAEHDPLGRFIVNTRHVSKPHELSNYVRARCERGRLSASQFLLTQGNRMPGDTARDTCFAVLFRMHPKAARACLSHPFIASVVNHCERRGGETRSAFLGALAPAIVLPETRLTADHKALFREITLTVPLGTELLNCNARAFAFNANILLILLKWDMEEELKFLLRRYGGAMTPALLNRGTMARKRASTGRPLTQAREKNYAEVARLLENLGAKSEEEHWEEEEDARVRDSIDKIGFVDIVGSQKF